MKIRLPLKHKFGETVQITQECKDRMLKSIGVIISDSFEVEKIAEVIDDSFIVENIKVKVFKDTAEIFYGGIFKVKTIDNPEKIVEADDFPCVEQINLSELEPDKIEYGVEVDMPLEWGQMYKQLVKYKSRIEPNTEKTKEKSIELNEIHFVFNSNKMKLTTIHNLETKRKKTLLFPEKYPIYIVDSADEKITDETRKLELENYPYLNFSIISNNSILQKSTVF